MDGQDTRDGEKPPIGFRRHLRAEIAPGNGVYLFGEAGVTVLSGDGIEAVARLLDGTRTLSEVLAARPAGLPPDEVGRLLARLAGDDLLTSHGGNTLADPAEAVFWDAAGLDVSAAATGFDGARIRVRAVGGVDPGPTSAALAGIGPVCLENHGPADLSVVLCEDYLDPALDGVDAEHRDTRVPWLLAKPVGTRVWLGPVFDPAGPGCWHCLADRLRRHRVAERSAQRALGRTGPPSYPRSAPRVLAGLAGHLVALEAGKWLAGLRHPAQRAVWTFDSLGLDGRSHELRPRPQCAVCGDPGLMRALAREPVRPVSRRKAELAGDGGHRAHTPAKTLARYRHLVSPVTGLVREIRQDRRGPAMFNSFRSGANIAVSALSVDRLRAAVRFESGGKGVTALDAEVGALGEAIERYSGTFAGDEERVSGSFRSLGADAIHPNSCQLYDERQYAGRAEWNPVHAPFQFVCEPLDPGAVLDWTPVWSLTSERFRLLPTGLLYFDTPAASGSPSVFADSNGNAAGSSLEDALLQGMLEVVERDAVALWWYNRTRVPGVDIDAFADPWISGLRDVYAGLGRDIWVLDVTSDVGIPVMVAVSRRWDRQPEDITFGFGAHLDPRIAVRRALTELNQLMPPLIESEDAYGCEDVDAVRWWRQAKLAENPYLAPSPAVRSKRPDDYGNLSDGDLLAEVELVRARLERLGLDVLVLDQTRPDTGMPVVKVVVPGLRHFWARFAPGRLFDVPVKLGLLPSARRYEELNPYPMFL